MKTQKWVKRPEYIEEVIEITADNLYEVAKHFGLPVVPRPAIRSEKEILEVGLNKNTYGKGWCLFRDPNGEIGAILKDSLQRRYTIVVEVDQ